MTVRNTLADPAPATPSRALVVGRDASEIHVLSEIALVRLGEGSEVVALELDTTSIDEELAWGTEMPHLRAVVGCDADPPFLGDQPLAEDGSTWRAILGAAERAAAEVIVIAHRPQSWLGRLLFGSAADDLVEHSDRPVLIVDVDQRSVRATRSRPDQRNDKTFEDSKIGEHQR